jgi:hypothetical protein
MERNDARNGLAERELRVQGVISRSPMMRTEINQARGCHKPTERTQVEHNLNPDIQFRGWSVAGKQPKENPGMKSRKQGIQLCSQPASDFIPRDSSDLLEPLADIPVGMKRDLAFNYSVHFGNSDQLCKSRFVSLDILCTDRSNVDNSSCEKNETTHWIAGFRLILCGV